jgi:hypothetical protein
VRKRPDRASNRHMQITLLCLSLLSLSVIAMFAVVPNTYAAQQQRATTQDTSPGSGGTTTNNGGTTSNNGGGTTNNGGTTSNNGGGTTNNGGGTTNNGGGTTNNGGGTTNNGGTTSNNGGTTSNNGGTGTTTGSSTPNFGETATAIAVAAINKVATANARAAAKATAQAQAAAKATAAAVAAANATATAAAIPTPVPTTAPTPVPTKAPAVPAQAVTAPTATPMPTATPNPTPTPLIVNGTPVVAPTSSASIASQLLYNSQSRTTFDPVAFIIVLLALLGIISAVYAYIRKQGGLAAVLARWNSSPSTQSIAAIPMHADQSDMAMQPGFYAQADYVPAPDGYYPDPEYAQQGYPQQDYAPQDYQQPGYPQQDYAPAVPEQNTVLNQQAFYTQPMYTERQAEIPGMAPMQPFQQPVPQSVMPDEADSTQASPIVSAPVPTVAGVANGMAVGQLPISEPLASAPPQPQRQPDGSPDPEHPNTEMVKAMMRQAQMGMFVIPDRE